MESSVPATTNYLSIINRRRWSFLIPCIVVILSSIALCFYLPSIYKSTAKILVKQSEISSYYVKQSVTSYAEERVRSIKQIILNSKRIKDMIEQNKLYPDLQKELPIKRIVYHIRDKTKITNITDETNFLGSSESIVFALSYEDTDPELAQHVTKLLTAMFLEENINIRKKQSLETTQFIQKEMNDLEKEIGEIDEHVSSFKKEHIKELPSLLKINIQRLQGVELKREALQEKLLNKKDVQRDLRMRLAIIPKHNKELSDRGKLTDLEARLANLRSQYSEAYPDVINLKAELAELEKKISSKSGQDGKNQSYLLNPQHIALSAQLSTVLNDINSLKRQLDELNRKEVEYQKRIETTLSIEDEYTVLVNKRGNTQKKYDDLMRKLMDAKVSHGLEEEQKGEQFTLLRRANYPRSPYKPNRLALILLGCFLGVGVGTGIVGMQEYFDHSIRDEHMLANISSGTVLGSIPVIISDKDVARKRKIRFIIVAIMVLAVSVGIVLALNYYLSFSVIEG